MKRRREEVLVLAAVFLDLVGFGMVFPDIQTRAESFLKGDALAAKVGPGLLIGALLALSFIVQLFASPRWGSLSDRVGRRPVFVLCQGFSAAALAIYGMAASYPLLLLSRALSGLGSANVAVAQAWSSDVYPEADRAKALGRISAALSAGLIVGPALGGFLARFGGNALIGIVGGSLSALGALLAYFGMAHAPKPETEAVPRKRAAIDLSLLTRFPAIRPLILVSAVASFALATLEGTFGRLIKAMLGYTELEFGIIFSYESLLAVGIQGIGLAFIIRRWGDSKTLRIGFALQAIGLMLNPLAGPIAGWVPGMATLLLASTLYASGNALATPTIASATSRLTSPQVQGELFGLLQIARNFGFVVGPILGGHLFDLWHPAPYLFAGIVSLVAILFVPSLDRTEPTGPPEA